MKAKLIVAALLSANALSLTSPDKGTLVSKKANDISENQKKLFAHMQKKAGSEI